MRAVEPRADCVVGLLGEALVFVFCVFSSERTISQLCLGEGWGMVEAT